MTCLALEPDCWRFALVPSLSVSPSTVWTRTSPICRAGYSTPGPPGQPPLTDRATGLAHAKRLIATGHLHQPDLLARLDKFEWIHGCVLHDTRKATFFSAILPAVQACQDTDRVAAVVAQAEAFLIAGVVSAETQRVPVAHLLEPLIDRQTARGVNVRLNLTWRIEVLIHQDREPEAEAAIAAFADRCGAGSRIPGVYVNWPLRPSLSEAVAAMRQRTPALKY